MSDDLNLTEIDRIRERLLGGYRRLARQQRGEDDVNDIDIEAIRGRCGDRYKTDGVRSVARIGLAIDDVAALLAEVDRLTAVIVDMDRRMDNEIGEKVDLLRETTELRRRLAETRPWPPEVQT